MKASTSIRVIAMFALLFSGCRAGAATKPGAAANNSETTSFEAARLIVEINATDGDAGLQIFLDHDSWQSVALYRPDGKKILDVTNQSVLKDYGLTEFFSESSEPPFTKFPLEKFKGLFPPGMYRLTGVTVDGKNLESHVKLTHDFPEGPKILAPQKDAQVPAGDVVVRWEPVTEPAGIEIIGYQVQVVREDTVEQVFSADLPPGATSVHIAPEFLVAGQEHKVEVLAVEKNRNQTLTELVFKAA